MTFCDLCSTVATMATRDGKVHPRIIITPMENQVKFIHSFSQVSQQNKVTVFSLILFIVRR